MSTPTPVAPSDTPTATVPAGTEVVPVDFESLGVPTEVVASLLARGITSAFPIQGADRAARPRRARRVRARPPPARARPSPSASRWGPDGHQGPSPPPPGAGPGADPRAGHPDPRRAGAPARAPRPARRHLLRGRRLRPADDGRCARASTSPSRAPATSPTWSAPRGTCCSTRSRGSWSSTRPTAWPTWASCPRSGACSTGCASRPPDAAVQRHPRRRRRRADPELPAGPRALGRDRVRGATTSTATRATTS